MVLGLFLYYRVARAQQANQLKGLAQQEQAILRIEHAQQAAAAERQLNEFIAHVRPNEVQALEYGFKVLKVNILDLERLLFLDLHLKGFALVVFSVYLGENRSQCFLIIRRQNHFLRKVSVRLDLS